MKYLLKVTVAITLLPLLIAVSYLPTYAQNTAPVPTTFEILSPSDSSLPFQMNHDYTRNRKIFYGGDFAALEGSGVTRSGFQGWTGTTIPITAAEQTGYRGNAHLSRLTLGGTKYYDNTLGVTQFGDGLAYVADLPGSYNRQDYATAGTSWDPDDIGDDGTGTVGTFPNYAGHNGFLAINEGDSLVIRLTGFADPNNRFKTQSGDPGQYVGWGFETKEYAFDIANPKNDSANGGRFGVVASTVPGGGSFNSGIFRWTPSFIQGDGTFDNSNRNGIYFVDANISNGTTTSETAKSRPDTSAGATVGIGLGELRDSLYVVYFTATDDGIPPKTGQDSLFILVNDSIANPPPRFTTRNVVRPNGTVVNYTKSGIQFSPDSLLSYSEGDSIVITFNATDQDSAQGGGLNQALTFGVPNWARFIKRPSSHTDSLALDTNSVLVSGSPRALKVRIQVGYNVADTLGNNLPDTVRLVVSVTDESANAVNDTMLFKIANVNRPPIWDADTSSKPSDSALVYSFSPAAVEPDSVEAFTPIPVTNGVTDSLYFSQYIYDPDPLVRDSLGPGLTYSTTSNLGSFFSTTSGLLEVLLTSLDTLSQTFPISATDTDPNSPKTATVTLTLRVAPEPEVAETYPLTGYPGQDITIFGSGFGLFDDSDSTALSKVVFRSRDSNGQAQNLRATVNSWSRDRINVTIPRNAAVSLFSVPLQQIIPDTIEISSSVFTSPTLYPFVITLPDSTTIYQMESSNITSTSAVVKWRTAFTGSDSVIVATVQDTLDVTGTNVNFDIFKDSNGNYWPYFVIPNADTLTYTRSTVQVFRGSTSTTDQVHVITLEGLVPATKYQFIIALKDELFFGDTLRNLNGPYAPAKISRDNVGNGAIRGFLLETLPEQNNNGQTFAVAGKVVNSSGSAAIGAVVTLQVVDKDNVADTTLPLTSTVGSDSSWVVNLGNAVIDTTSDVSDRLYQHKQGDYLVISIAADKDVGFTKFTTTRAATTPQIVNLNGATTLLVAAVDYDIRLKVGLNLIGIPVNLFLTEPQTAKAVLTEITGGTPSITRYVTSTATQETIIKTIAGGSNQFIGASDWNLVDSDGNYYDAYFLSLDQLNFLNLSGSVYGTALPVKLFPAPGLYWIARPAQSSSLFYAWSSRTMLSNIANATEIFRYNRDTQQYDTAVIDGSTSAFIGTDFAIDASEGYIIDITAASQWDMNTPTATQMANASVMFDNISGVTPSLTLDLSQASAAAGTGALRNIRLTDITSSAAKISWVGNTSMNVQVRYGKAAEGLTSVAQFKANDLKGGVGVLQLLGLKPETEYVYEIVSNGITYNNNGNPFTFKSAKIGIGDPYTVYGRLVDETGQPLADAVIYLSAKSNDEVSSTIAVLTDERGYWTANLANLKLVNSGAVYAWKAGDEIKVTAVYGDASTSFRTLVSGNSPQNVIRVSDTDGVASTDKKEAARVALPKAFALGQNYPNPFNPSTTIAFDIPEDRTSGVQVELKVFNVRGQVIRNLVNDTKQPGRYVIQWNGDNDNNEKVASGVYFYRVKAGDYVATRKMVLLK